MLTDFSLETVDNAVSMLNRGWYQAKIDLKNGYRSIGISERSYECTGIKWKLALIIIIHTLLIPDCVWTRQKVFRYFRELLLQYENDEALGF